VGLPLPHPRVREALEDHQGPTRRIPAAVELDLSNLKLEGLNSKIRLINPRGYGHHGAAALVSMIYLCCGGITVQLPTER
jgi:transposase